MIEDGEFLIKTCEFIKTCAQSELENEFNA